MAEPVPVDPEAEEAVLWAVMRSRLVRLGAYQLNRWLDATAGFEPRDLQFRHNRVHDHAFKAADMLEKAASELSSLWLPADAKAAWLHKLEWWGKRYACPELVDRDEVAALAAELTLLTMEQKR